MIPDTPYSPMSSLKTALLLLYVVILFSACSQKSITDKYRPISNHKARVNTLGFKISPPPGNNWFEKHVDNTLWYIKKTSSPSYLLTSRATEIQELLSFHDQHDFIEHVKKTKIQKGTTGNYKNTTFTYTLQDSISDFCLKYYYSFEDHSDKYSISDTYVITKESGYYCMHPEKSSAGIDIFYQEKFYQNSKATSYRVEGERFVNSLTFIHLAR